jgi:hypothetical protein
LHQTVNPPSNAKMKLSPRYEVHDFRDPEIRRPVEVPNNYADYPSPRPGAGSAWDGVRRVVGFLGAVTFVGLTAWNLVTIGGWMSDWYARKRAERAAAAVRTFHWKRGHSREWTDDETRD